jgi:D-serine deaminase-like pyridoxal phosphate-dependent protein
LSANIVGQRKLDRLVARARRTELKAVVDSLEVAEGLSAAVSANGLMLPLLIECDTGGSAAASRLQRRSRNSAASSIVSRA